LDKPTEEQALAGKDQEKLIEAMEKEREQLRKYGVYEKLENYVLERKRLTPNGS
jgi:hypothetical protein